MSELVGLGDAARELERRGGRLYAISVDPPETSRGVVEKRQLAFSILSDPQHDVIARYGLVHKDGSPHHGDISVPAQILIGRDGRIVWQHVSRRIQDRVAP